MSSGGSFSGRFVTLTTGAFIGLALCAGVPSAAQAPPQPPSAQEGQEQPDTSKVTNVGGRWELNSRLSDRLPEQAGAPARGEPGEHGGGGGGHRGGGGMPGMGRGGMGGRGGGGRGGEGRGESVDAEQVREILQAQRTLVIVEHSDRVSITDENGRVQRIVTNGEKVKDEWAGLSFDRRTHWEGRKLVTEIALADGTQVTQTYEKQSEGLQLVVTTTIEHGKGGGPRAFKRVYDQAFE